MNIVIPYMQQKNCDELRYALRSLHKNLLEDFDVTIIGYKPKWIKNIKYIPFSDCDIAAKNQINKLVIASSIYDKFIEWHDDMFLIKPVSYIDVVKPYFLEIFDNIKYWGNKPYQIQLKKGYKKIKKFISNKPIYNFATHTPKMYESNKLLTVIDRYDLINNPLLFFENFYMNTFNNNSEVISIQKYKIGIYNNNEYFNPYIINKECLFINFNEKGLKSGIFQYIKSVFDRPSRFEL